MKRFTYTLLSVIVTSLLITSCGVQSVPIKGNYQDRPFEVTVDKTKDQVWDGIIDFFAQNGISIKTLDRQSGLIVSDRTNLVDNFSFERKDGSLENPKAYVVVERRTSNMGMELKPSIIKGDWNVRIKERDGKTSINVNLVNIEAAVVLSNMYGATNKIDLPAKSTGVFERFIAQSVSQ